MSVRGINKFYHHLIKRQNRESTEGLFKMKSREKTRQVLKSDFFEVSKGVRRFYIVYPLTTDLHGGG